MSFRTCPECGAEGTSYRCDECGRIELTDEQKRLDVLVMQRASPSVAFVRIADLEQQLAAMTAARDRIYQIAKTTFALHLMTPELATELDELHKVGSAGGAGPSRHRLFGRELNAVRRAIDIARDADLLEWDTHDQRVLAIAALDRLFADGSIG
jgi:hypothetical protein